MSAIGVLGGLVLLTRSFDESRPTKDTRLPHVPWWFASCCHRFRYLAGAVDEEVRRGAGVRFRSVSTPTGNLATLVVRWRLRTQLDQRFPMISDLLGVADQGPLHPPTPSRTAAWRH